MRVAILLAGRIKGWEYTKDALKSLQNKYNAIFFVSLNQEAADESTLAFCEYFNLTPEQIATIKSDLAAPTPVDPAATVTPLTPPATPA